MAMIQSDRSLAGVNKEPASSHGESRCAGESQEVPLMFHILMRKVEN
jgi:hypothetical protein